MRKLASSLMLLAAFVAGPKDCGGDPPGGAQCATADDCGPTTEPKCVMQCRDGQCIESCFGGVP